ncbi:hypothetical protein FV242_27450 [Methylobacterium sp. WL64]|uniref:hypothetical protein n=1 Tax=Methylobacterium sp. WL64 TaxID=2603894 RepID=UPI0011CC2D3E|nr:hypothetical protein [Methylobacterium sp. WL64]TXM98848.1 hypothetical protein FV242_27450 [Methylobacterium sp. WL64]
MTERPDDDHLAPADLKAAFAWIETATRVAGTAVLDDYIAAATSVLDGEGRAGLTFAAGPLNTHNRSAIGFQTSPAAAKQAGAAA